MAMNAKLTREMETDRARAIAMAEIILEVLKGGNNYKPTKAFIAKFKGALANRKIKKEFVEKLDEEYDWYFRRLREYKESGDINKNSVWSLSSADHNWASLLADAVFGNPRIAAALGYSDSKELQKYYQDRAKGLESWRIRENGSGPKYEMPCSLEEVLEANAV